MINEDKKKKGNRNVKSQSKAITIDLNNLNFKNMLLLINNAYSKSMMIKLGYDESLAVYKFLIKAQPSFAFSIIEKKFLMKFPDLLPKIARITTFHIVEPNFLLLNCKNKINEEIYLMKGSFEKLNLVKKFVITSYENFLLYMKKLKANKEDELFKKLLKANSKYTTILNDIDFKDITTPSTNNNQRKSFLYNLGAEKDPKKNNNIVLSIDSYIDEFISPIKVFDKDIIKQYELQEKDIKSHIYGVKEENILQQETSLASNSNNDLKSENFNFSRNFKLKENLLSNSTLDNKKLKSKVETKSKEKVLEKSSINLTTDVNPIVLTKKFDKNILDYFYIYTFQRDQEFLDFNQVQLNEIVNKEENDSDEVKKEVSRFSLISNDKCYFFTLPSYEMQIIRREYEDALFKQELLMFLRRCHVFNKLEDLILKDIIVKYFTEKHYLSGDKLFNEGETIDKLYFIREGSVCLSLRKSALGLKKLYCELQNLTFLPEILDEKSDLYKKINKIKVIPILHCSENTIIGLKNIIFNGSSLFTAEVNSKTLEVLEINYSEFSKLSKVLFEININIKELEDKMLKVMFERIAEIYESIYDVKNILHKGCAKHERKLVDQRKEIIYTEIKANEKNEKQFLPQIAKKITFLQEEEEKKEINLNLSLNITTVGNEIEMCKKSKVVKNSKKTKQKIVDYNLEKKKEDDLQFRVQSPTIKFENKVDDFSKSGSIEKTASIEIQNKELNEVNYEKSSSPLRENYKRNKITSEVLVKSPTKNEVYDQINKSNQIIKINSNNNDISNISNRLNTLQENQKLMLDFVNLKNGYLPKISKNNRNKTSLQIQKLSRLDQASIDNLVVSTQKIDSIITNEIKSNYCDKISQSLSNRELNKAVSIIEKKENDKEKRVKSKLHTESVQKIIETIEIINTHQTSINKIIKEKAKPSYSTIQANLKYLRKMDSDYYKLKSIKETLKLNENNNIESYLILNPNKNKLIFKLKNPILRINSSKSSSRSYRSKSNSKPMSSRSPNKIKIQYKVKKQLNPNNMANILKYIEGSKSNRINKVKENIDFSIKNDRLKEIFN